MDDRRYTVASKCSDNLTISQMPDIQQIPKLETISRYVYYHAEHQPDAEALVWGSVRIDYLTLSQRVEITSRALIAAGLKRGDRVAFLGSPRPEFFIVMMAVVDIGGIWMGLHPRYQYAEFSHVVSQASPKFIFGFSEIDERQYDEELFRLDRAFDFIEQIVLFDQKMDAPGIAYEAFVESAAEVDDNALSTARTAVEKDDPAVIIFTSGTTGKPKGAMNSHFGLVHCAHVELSRWPNPDFAKYANQSYRQHRHDVELCLGKRGNVGFSGSI